MSTEYGIIKCARYEKHTIEIYSSVDDYPTIKLFSERDYDDNKKVGVKIVLDHKNIDEFLGALACALKDKNIFSNYLNPEGEYKR